MRRRESGDNLSGSDDAEELDADEIEGSGSDVELLKEAPPPASRKRALGGLQVGSATAP